MAIQSETTKFEVGEIEEMTWKDEIRNLLENNLKMQKAIINDRDGHYLQRLFYSINKPEYDAEEEEYVYQLADKLFGIKKLIKIAESTLGEHLGWGWNKFPSTVTTFYCKGREITTVDDSIKIDSVSFRLKTLYNFLQDEEKEVLTKSQITGLNKDNNVIREEVGLSKQEVKEILQYPSVGSEALLDFRKKDTDKIKIEETKSYTIEEVKKAVDSFIAENKEEILANIFDNPIYEYQVEYNDIQHTRYVVGNADENSKLAETIQDSRFKRNYRKVDFEELEIMYHPGKSLVEIGDPHKTFADYNLYIATQTFEQEGLNQVLDCLILPF